MDNKMEHKKEGFRKIKPEKMEKIMAMESPKENYPHFGISLMHLPEAKDWEIGKEYNISLKLKQTSMDMHKNKEGKEMGNAGFDIVGIKVYNENKGTDKKIQRYA